MNPVVRSENPTFPMPSFKIIIPVYNPPDDFLETLSALQTDGLEDSVIVVDDGSTNGRFEIESIYELASGVSNKKKTSKTTPI
jgi:GT2 family glycosyltransferase